MNDMYLIIIDITITNHRAGYDAVQINLNPKTLKNAKCLDKDLYPFINLTEKDISEIYQYLIDNHFKMIRPKGPEDLEGLKIIGVGLGEEG